MKIEFFFIYRRTNENEYIRESMCLNMVLKKKKFVQNKIKE